MIKKKLHLKDDLSGKIFHILYNTGYKNTDMGQYLNYTKLNTTLIDPSRLLIEPFFTKKYIEKLDLNITNNKDSIFDPVINKAAKFYLEKYFVYLCRNKVLLDKNRYKMSKHPKLSIIIPIYNRAKYIETILLSMQNQNLKDIEIIFIDDESKDSGIEIIEEFMKEDDRIILLKNKKNSGIFYSRFAGLVFSKGEYIAFADSDDFFLPDIFGNAYNTGIHKNVEIVQWSTLVENRERKVEEGEQNHTADVVLTSNELKYYMFYEHHDNYARLENHFLWDKIYKRNLLLRSMHKFPDDLINDHISTNEDNFFLFVIFQNANSYCFINQYGYYWFLGEPISSTNKLRSAKNANKSFTMILRTSNLYSVIYQT